MENKEGNLQEPIYGVENTVENDLETSIRPGRKTTKYFTKFASDSLVLVPAKCKLENWMFQKAWLVLSIILVLGTIITFIIPKILPSNIYFLNRSTVELKFIVERMIEFSIKVVYPLLVILIIEGVLLVSLVKKTSQVFVDLEIAGRLKKPSSYKQNKNIQAKHNRLSKTGIARKKFFSRIFSLPTSADNFEEEMIDAVKSNWRYLFVIFFMGLVAYFVFGYNNFQSEFQISYWPYIVNIILALFLMPLFISYVGGLALWAMIVISVYISKLNLVFDIKVNPVHPDKAGGLRRLGGLTFHMAVIALLPILFLIAWSLGGYWSDTFPGWIEVRAVVIILIIALNITLFFLPLWNIHTEMVRVGELHQDEVMQEIEEIQTRINQLLKTSAADSLSDAMTEAELLNRQIEIIRDVKQIDKNFPSWPFDANIALKFSIPQILPVLSLLAGLGDTESNVVNTLIDGIKEMLGLP